MPGYDQSHSRRNLLTGEWVLVSPHRTQRPWQGQQDEPEPEPEIPYDENCYLCPGNRRANGETNPDYQGTFVFDNDYSALQPEVAVNGGAADNLLEARPESGICRVVCYTAAHHLRLATMDQHAIAGALGAMFAQFRELDERPDIGYVQIFENRGAMMGCSNPHPHSQIWATRHLPTEPGKEARTQAVYFERHSRLLLSDYLQRETDDGVRIVFSNERFTALVPYWAVWPYELLLLPQSRVASPNDLQDDDLQALAEVLKNVLVAYDRLFATAMPYSMGFHPRPSDGGAHPGWLFHAHIYPPLLRSATVRKHMVGFEMLAMPQRDITPELAAEQLRAVLR